MSSAHTTYKLDEAQAIMSELRTIKKAICTGEKERRDLMQVRDPVAHLHVCLLVFILLKKIHTCILHTLNQLNGFIMYEYIIVYIFLYIHVV